MFRQRPQCRRMRFHQLGQRTFHGDY
jgi:hypothetical protein